MEKKFQSVVRRVVLLPMSVMTMIVCITIVSCVIGFLNMRQQMIDSNISTLQISQNQLENLLNQIDHTFIEYWNSNESYAYLKGYSRSTPREQYLVHESDTLTWLVNLSNSYSEVQGAFAYYENIGNFLFRGSTNPDMNDYIKTRVKSGHSSYNHWELATVNNIQYILNIKHYNHFYGGVWIPTQSLSQNLDLANSAYRGPVYLVDREQNNTLADAQLNRALFLQGSGETEFYVDSQTLYNYLALGTQEDILLGILIPQTSLVEDIPLLNKGIFLLALLSVLMVPVVTLWLRRKIAIPVRAIDDAMQLIGEGNMDYRIEVPDKNAYDEFDRLFVRFNQMMDELNELEFSLYKTKLKEQQTKLKYISQQIRPHFILNALNILYTYEENEFLLIKKMVLYLTEYFRYIVNLKVDFVEVEQELRHIENYLNIQKERYLDRFDFFVEWEVAAQKLMLPPLIIQTFVENCMKYGMSSEHKTFIYVLASREHDSLKLMIADTGDGFSKEMLERISRFTDTREHQDGLGVGIENAIERMDILYKERVKVTARNALSGGAIIEMELPIIKQI